MRSYLVLLMTATALGLTGCPTTAMPRLFGPGPAQYQRDQAVQFDPYPDQDAGPKVVGGRPLDYNRQIPEIDRSRITPSDAQPAPQGAQRWSPRNWFGSFRRGAAPPVVGPALPSATVAPPAYSPPVVETPPQTWTAPPEAMPAT